MPRHPSIIQHAHPGQPLARSWVSTILCCLVLLPCLLRAAPAPEPDEQPQRVLHVVADDNYPPFLFRDANGTVRGYLVDYWALWSKRTGVEVKLEALKWADAQRQIRQGRADVIDLIFRTAPREVLYDFSPSYADLPVNIYHHPSITGITGAETLQGFRVGVMEGDACVDELERRGITHLTLYGSYTELIEAAVRQETKVFCLDEIPAQFYFYRLGVEHEFHKGFTLYTGHFHRAVRKGDAATLALVERGMAAISEDEDAALREKWFGTPLDLGSYARAAGLTGAAVLAAGLLLLLWNVLLRRKVRGSTHRLRQALDELQVANQAERQSRENLSAALEASPDLLFEIDADGRYIEVFGSHDSLLASPRETLVGRFIADVLPPEAADAVMQSVTAALATGRDFGRTIQLALPIGVRWFELSSARKEPVAGGKPTVMVLSRDVTQRLESERELADMRVQAMAAEEASLAKSRFLANMSHEIRTPLNGIIGMAHLIRESGLSAEQEQRLAKLEAAADHLLQILSAILDLSKIEAGKVVLEALPLQLEDIVANTIAIIEEGAHAKGLSLSSHIEHVPGELLGDAVRLQQALLNYAHNAVKFADRGSITFRVRRVREDESSAWLRFEVVDTGIGIEPDALGRLFDSFEQADVSTTRRFGGTGLGLAITKGLAELMGGEAGVESTLGVGSTFWFTARLGKGRAIESGVSAPERSLAESLTLLRDRYPAERVLLAEDNEINAEVATALLRRAGLTVDLAVDGVEAVDKATAHDYSLIFMDVQMPRMNGLDAARRILEARPDAPPIIAMTANAFSEDRAVCLAAGMRDFLSKPVEPKQLYETVLRWLEERSLAPG